MEGWIWAAWIESNILLTYDGSSSTTVHSEQLVDDFSRPLIWRGPDDCMIWISEQIREMSSWPKSFGCKRMLKSEVEK